MTSFLYPLARNLSLYRGPNWVRHSQRRSYLGSVTYLIQAVSTSHFYLKHDILGAISEHSKSGELSCQGPARRSAGSHAFGWSPPENMMFLFQ